MIYVILIVWLAMWIYKNFKQTSVKSYFKKLLAQSKLGFSKLEFELFGLRDEREELRKEFDRLNETIDAYNTQVNNKGNTEDTKKLFENKIEETKKLIEEVKDAINVKDIAIQEAEKAKDTLHQQMKMLRDYVARKL